MFWLRRLTLGIDEEALGLGFCNISNCNAGSAPVRVSFFIIGRERMINTKIYKAVYGLAEKLMEADRKGDKANFDSLYAQLKAICTDNENTDKDHPEQWETLADFTENLKAALEIYEKALGKALAINAKDHLSSIGLSVAKLQVDLGQNEAAIKSLESAQVSANKRLRINSLRRRLIGCLNSCGKGRKRNKGRNEAELNSPFGVA